MRTVPLAIYAGPYPCRHCGVLVRTVLTIDGSPLTITNSPVPHGNILPWPATNPNSPAEARIYPHPITNEPAWEEHACRYH